LNNNFRKLLRTIIFISTGLIILYLVYYKQNQAYLAECTLQGIAEKDCSLILKIYEDFKSSNLLVLLLVLFLFMISNLSRALRWLMLLKPIGVNAKLSNAFNTIMLGYFANLGLPRVGEVIRAATLAKYENSKVDKVMGTVVVDRAMDVVAMLIFMLLAMIGARSKILVFLRNNNDVSGKLSSFINSPWLIAILIFIALVSIVILRSQKFKKSIIGVKIWSFIYGMMDGLKSISSLEKPWIFVMHTVIIWVMYYLMLYIGFFAFEGTAHLGPIAGLVVFVMGSLGIVIPSPGGMGTYHFLVTAGLTMYGVNEADGFSFANILFFTIQIFGNIFFGILALIVLPIINKKS